MQRGNLRIFSRGRLSIYVYIMHITRRYTHIYILPKKVKVTQSCLTLCNPWTVACQAPLSMEILKARILEWVATPSSRGHSHPRDQTESPALQADSLPSELPGKPSSYMISLNQKLSRLDKTRFS